MTIPLRVQENLRRGGELITDLLQTVSHKTGDSDAQYLNNIHQLSYPLPRMILLSLYSKKNSRSRCGKTRSLQWRCAGGVVMHGSNGSLTISLP